MKLIDKYEELQNKSTPQSKIIEQIFRAIEEEDTRQKNEIELIASENYTFEEVMFAAGSILTNKYAEGYPEKRYYGGCEVVDKVESIAIEQCKKLFHCGYANVQPHSGSQANQAVYMALLQPGDKVLGMSLDCGGHLTHGSKVSSSGILYESYSYGVNSDGYIDYDEVEKIALEVKPKLIVCGASAYSRIIDFAKFRKIADKVGAYLMADIAHIAGLIVAGVHPSPIGIAHVVSSTTHKTLRGTRGGIIMTNDEEISKKINKAVFPGIQGGPLMHIIAAKAVGFAINETTFFKKYIKSVVENAKIMAEELKRDFSIISNGTDNHLMLVDVSKIGITGLDAETKLKKIGITVNKNTIPGDKNKPSVTSGIRIGTAAITSRGFGKNDCLELARIIADCLTGRGFDENHLKERVNKLLSNKPYKFKWTDVFNNL